MDDRFRTLRRMSTLGPVLAMLAFGAACASPRGSGATGQEAIQVHVDNNLIPSTTVSISATTETGSPVLLGSLVAGAERTFTYKPIVSTGTFQLVADPPGPSGQLTSRPIIFPESATATVEWELSTNNVVVK